MARTQAKQPSSSVARALSCEANASCRGGISSWARGKRRRRKQRHHRAREPS